MDEQTQQLEMERLNVDRKINEFKNIKKKIQDKIKTNNKINKIKLEKKESYSENGNKLIRVSNLFNKKLENIDEKRLEIGLDKLSHPKKTDLIIKHKNWINEEQDIIHFNTNIEEGKEDEE